MKDMHDTHKHFKALRDYIFDDYETVEEEYAKHRDVNIVIVSHVSVEVAEEILSTLGIEDMKVSDLVGDWMASTSRNYSNGTDIKSIDYMGKAEKQTKTVVTESWEYIK